jgi:NAD(P)H-hydrate epimerase
MGAAVKADLTVTFSRAKPGHFIEPGCTHRGGLTISDIGIPEEILSAIDSSTLAVTESDVFLPKRTSLSHKGDYGRLLLIGGSPGYTGAPSLAARAAVRAGAGLVSLGVPSEIYSITAVKNDEAMPFPLPSFNGLLDPSAFETISARVALSDTVVIGMGLGRSAAVTELVTKLTRAVTVPLVIDADGLFAVGEDISCLSGSKAQIVLTPHEGEFSRLGGDLTASDRLSAARGFARRHNCTLVLKGHRTLVAFPDDDVNIISAGNPGMAKGGSGDVLSGVIGALLCQLPFKRAVVTACWLHARAGDICAEKFGEYSMTPSDMIEALCEATTEITYIM